MLASRVQSTTPAVRPYSKKASAKAAEKLGKISFDIRSNKLISEPYKDLYVKRCGDGDGGEYSGMSVCDPVWGITC